MIAPEGELPIGIVDGDIVKFVGGAKRGLIVDGGGESRDAKGSDSAWKGAEG